MPVAAKKANGRTAITGSEPAQASLASFRGHEKPSGRSCQGVRKAPETPPWKISDRKPPPVLAEIRFDFARADLTRASERMRIEGHCDARGDDTCNHALAARRATRVRDYLVDRGYEADRLLVVAVGKRKPRCIAAEEGCWETNRRAEFKLNVLP